MNANQTLVGLLTFSAMALGAAAPARADLRPAATVGAGAGVAVEAVLEDEVDAGVGWSAGLAGDVVVAATSSDRARVRLGARLDLLGAPRPSGPLAAIALQAVVRGEAQLGAAAGLAVELAAGGGALHDPVADGWRGALAIGVAAGVRRQLGRHAVGLTLRLATLVAGPDVAWFVVLPIPTADRALVTVTLGPEATW